MSPSWWWWQFGQIFKSCSCFLEMHKRIEVVMVTFAFRKLGLLFLKGSFKNEGMASIISKMIEWNCQLLNNPHFCVQNSFSVSWPPLTNLTTGLHQNCVVLIIHIWMNMINDNCGDERWIFVHLSQKRKKKLALESHIIHGRDWKDYFLRTTFSVTFCFKELGY